MNTKPTNLELFDAPIVLPAGSPVIVANGLGVDSTAMLVAMRRQGIRPDLITFADTGGEKPETYAHLDVMNDWCRSVGFPETTVVRKLTKDSTPYNDLEGNCLSNETLPGIAFHMKSCSIKWKGTPQDQFVTGVTKGPNKRDPHPVWIEAQRRGVKPVKLIGYDSGPADLRRSKKAITENDKFYFRYPLQDLGWARKDCIKAIIEEGLPVPVKSACWFCPVSQKWELWWLAGAHPELFERALKLEYNAMTGHHTRFDEIEMGGSFEDLIGSGDRWPSTKTTVGLGMKFAWGHWARMNKIVDGNGKVIADPDHCLSMATLEQESGGNAMDQRTCGLGGIPITVEREPLKEAA